MDTGLLLPMKLTSPALPHDPPAQLQRRKHVHIPGSHTVIVANTRRKSCEDCISSKRGCDKQKPTCSRCAARGRPCIYRQKAKPSNPPDSNNTSPLSDQTIHKKQQRKRRQQQQQDQQQEKQRPAVSSPQLSQGGILGVTGDSEVLDMIDSSMTSKDGNSKHNNDLLSLQLQRTFADTMFNSVMEVDDMNTNATSGSPGFARHELSLLPAGHSSSSAMCSSTMGFQNSGSPTSLSLSPSSSATSSTSGSPPNLNMPLFAAPDLAFDENFLDYSMLDSMPGLSSLSMDADTWFNQCNDFPELPALEPRYLSMPQFPAPLDCDPHTLQLSAKTSRLSMVCHFRPWEVNDPRSRIGCLVLLLKKLPSTFAETRATPFLTTEIYRKHQPRAITHAWTACTVYHARKPATESWAMRVVYEGVAALLRNPPLSVSQDPDAYTASGHVNTQHLLERLASVQALILYQTIRCFTGDALLSNSAARDCETLLDWALELTKLRNKMDDDLGGTATVTICGRSIQQKPPPSWEDWLIIESTRRTIVQAFLVVAIASILRNSDPPQCIKDPRNVFTISRHLWDANDPVSFFHAWRDKPQFLIHHTTPEIFTSEARPEDVCEFGRLWLYLKLGVADTEAFMAGLPIAKLDQGPC